MLISRGRERAKEREREIDRRRIVSIWLIEWGGQFRDYEKERVRR